MGREGGGRFFSNGCWMVASGNCRVESLGPFISLLAEMRKVKK